MATTDGKYVVRLQCHNCKRASEVELEKGTQATSARCPNCGVKALEVSPRPTL